MARCWSTPSAARAIGVFISTRTVPTMTTNKTNDRMAEAATNESAGDRDLSARFARAQAELIEILARLVLDRIESAAGAGDGPDCPLPRAVPVVRDQPKD